MILVLSDGGSKSDELYRFLNILDLPSIFHFSSFSEAGTFGKGKTIVGKASFKSFKRILIKNQINCVIDVIDAPMSDASRVMLEAAEELSIPVIKVILPVFRLNSGIAENIGVSVKSDYSYKSAAEVVNNTYGNVLFLASPYNVKAVADLVFDRGALYAPIPSGIEFDVDLALEFGIPLLNVIAVDDFSGASGIENVINMVDARLIVTDSSSEIFNKLEAASKTDCKVLFIQNTGLEYKYIVDNFDELSELLTRFVPESDAEEDGGTDDGDEINSDEV